MTASFRTAYVFVGEEFAALLKEVDSGYSFTYDAAYLASSHRSAVSLTLPLRDEAYESNVLFPFFDGLIPEGWLLDIVTRNWKININDRFGILLVACRDCIGTVSIREGKV